MKSFTELSLSEPLMRAITEMGFETPSPIQAQALPMLLEGSTDFIGLAATGTGKTAAFSIPMLEQIDTTNKNVQALILCPTRELALQVSGQITLLGKYKNVRALSIYGGAPYGEQLDGLRRGANVVVGTPGRVIDHIERGTLNLKNISHLILDEADEMISMGFQDDLEKILSAAFDGKEERGQIWLYSATMSSEIRRVADKYLKNPKTVQVNKTEMLSSTVTQLYYPTRESNKPEILCKVIDMADSFYGIIFCQTKSLVSDLTHYLTDRGYKVDSLHGDKDQNARERTMQSFREHKVKILVCTDVASRGLDVKDITHVINYSIPRELDSYVHRIGRTARSGKEGFAMSLVTPAQMGLLRRLENMTKSRMKEGVIPTRKEVGTKKVARMLEKFQGEKNAPRAVDLFDPTWLEVLSQLTPQETAARFIAMMNPGLFSESERAQMPGPPQRDGHSGGGSRDDDRRGDNRGGGYGRSGGGYGRGGDRRDGGRSFDRGGGYGRGGDRRDGGSFSNDRGGERSFERSELPVERNFERAERPERQEDRRDDNNGGFPTENRRSNDRYGGNRTGGRNSFIPRAPRSDDDNGSRSFNSRSEGFETQDDSGDNYKPREVREARGEGRRFNDRPARSGDGDRRNTRRFGGGSGFSPREGGSGDSKPARRYTANSSQGETSRGNRSF